MPGRALLSLLAVALAAPAAADDSLDCPGGIVAVGDAKIDLLGKCGPPSLQEVVDYSLATLLRYGLPGAGRRASATVETTGGRFSVWKSGMAKGMVRITAPQLPRCLKTLARNREIPGSE